MKKPLLLFLFCVSAFSFAQVQNFPNTQTESASGAPSGNCPGPNYFYVRTSNSNLYTCPAVNGSWTLQTSSGSGTVSANNGSAGAIANYASASGSTTVGPDANLTDASNTLSYTPGTLSLGAVSGAASGTATFVGTTSGSVSLGCGGAACSKLTTVSPFSAKTYGTATTCSANGTAANPSVVSCSSAAAGLFSCSATASAATCVVDTSAVTANSTVLIIPDAADGTTLSVTCNTSPTANAAPLLASKVAGTSFTINMPTITTNPACFQYYVIN